VRLPVGQTAQLGGTEASQDGKVALGVLVVDLDHAADEELLLFCSPGLPVVRLADGHGESLLASPILPLGLLFVLWAQVHVVLDHG
jgi:hypothetical protein